MPPSCMGFSPSPPIARPMRSLAALLIVVLIASGCAEYAEFRSDPTTAKVYINDQMVGFPAVPMTVREEGQGN